VAVDKDTILEKLAIAALAAGIRLSEEVSVYFTLNEVEYLQRAIINYQSEGSSKA
jgi:hypothetical protein